jgi:nucleoside-diphosphate-sugar epimerase
LIFLIGGEGFVGSAFISFFEEKGIHYEQLSRLNYHHYEGRSCDVLINANGNSKKYLANEDPLFDFDASVRSTLNFLLKIKSKYYIHLSSGDVYADPSNPNGTLESSVIDVCSQSRYGFSKYLAERIVERYHDNWLILRLSGMIGQGLKKNPIFDILNSQKLWISPDSEMQYINTQYVVEIIWDLMSLKIQNQIINLGGDGVVKIKDVIDLCRSKSKADIDSPVIRYELSINKLKSLTKIAIPESTSQVYDYIYNMKCFNALHSRHS